MAWTVPITWTPGQVVGATDLNMHIRDNELYLAGSGRPVGFLQYVSGLTTTSTTFVDMSAGSLIVTANLNGSRAIVMLTLWANFSNTITQWGSFTLIANSSVLAGNHSATYGLMSIGQNATSFMSCIGYFSGLSAGSNTFKPQWKTSGSGTLTGGIALAGSQSVTVTVWEG